MFILYTQKHNNIKYKKYSKYIKISGITSNVFKTFTKPFYSCEHRSAKINIASFQLPFMCSVCKRDTIFSINTKLSYPYTFYRKKFFENEIVYII